MRIIWQTIRRINLEILGVKGLSTELQFFVHMAPSNKGGRVEDHRMMFNMHFHLPQSFIQAILYIDKTDCMMSETLYTLTSVHSLHTVLYTFYN